MRASSGDSSSNRERGAAGLSVHRDDCARDEEDGPDPPSSSSSGIVDELLRAMKTVGNAGYLGVAIEDAFSMGGSSALHPAAPNPGASGTPAFRLTITVLTRLATRTFALM